MTDGLQTCHEKALVRKNNLTTKVLGRPPPMSSSATSSETSSTSQSSVPFSGRRRLLQKSKLHEPDKIYQSQEETINHILHLLVPKSLFEKKQFMPYNEDVNVKRCECSDPSCNKWIDLYPHAQVTKRNMWANKLK
ncbi:hypothetical protein HID58_027024 [Brassica napus]|uniref:Post-SET domain-containing protein n=1 Tax=Brassica napus TaxID=3708 RepID=A0ABQ8CQM2_BRANA|nr:hypothetical protein HID58_027024 [Brassica napus]